MISKHFLIFAAFLGFTGVALGAFGAHGLEATLEANDRVSTFETAARYHMYHALALLILAVLTHQNSKRLLQIAGYFLLFGTIIFSGSLYILAIMDIGFMGAIAPIGGLSLLIGWGLIGYSALKPHHIDG